MKRTLRTAGAALLLLVAASCSSSDDTSAPSASDEVTTTTETPEQTATTEAAPEQPVATEEAVSAFGDWYRAAVAEGGDELPDRYADEASAQEAFAGLVRILCALSADDPDQREAAGEAIKDDPEWFGDASFARSGIIMARIACGLET